MNICKVMVTYMMISMIGNNNFHIFTLVTRQSAALISVTQHAISQKTASLNIRDIAGNECFTISFLLPPLQYTSRVFRVLIYFTLGSVSSIMSTMAADPYSFHASAFFAICSASAAALALIANASAFEIVKIILKYHLIRHYT